MGMKREDASTLETKLWPIGTKSENCVTMYYV